MRTQTRRMSGKYDITEVTQPVLQQELPAVPIKTKRFPTYKRKTLSCEPCRKRRIKCTRERFCSTCKQRGKVCVWASDSVIEGSNPGPAASVVPIQQISIPAPPLSLIPSLSNAQPPPHGIHVGKRAPVTVARSQGNISPILASDPNSLVNSYGHQHNMAHPKISTYAQLPALNRANNCSLPCCYPVSPASQNSYPSVGWSPVEQSVQQQRYYPTPPSRGSPSDPMAISINPSSLLLSAASSNGYTFPDLATVPSPIFTPEPELFDMGTMRTPSSSHSISSYTGDFLTEGFSEQETELTLPTPDNNSLSSPASFSSVSSAEPSDYFGTYDVTTSSQTLSGAATPDVETKGDASIMSTTDLSAHDLSSYDFYGTTGYGNLASFDVNAPPNYYGYENLVEPAW